MLASWQSNRTRVRVYVGVDSLARSSLWLGPEGTKPVKENRSTHSSTERDLRLHPDRVTVRYFGAPCWRGLSSPRRSWELVRRLATRTCSTCRTATSSTDRLTHSPTAGRRRSRWCWLTTASTLRRGNFA